MSLFGSGMSYGHSHGNANLPLVLAGGTDLGLKHGSHLDFNQGHFDGYTLDKPGDHYRLCSRPANTDAHMSNLLLLMAQKMGVENDQIRRQQQSGFRYDSDTTRHTFRRADTSVFALLTVFAMQLPRKNPSVPEVGKFPPCREITCQYRGELVFVDHANRRGSLRVEGTGKFYRNDPHPFALLPYGIVRYHDAPADLRDVPLGTVLHAHGFLPPDPKISAVPVLPTNNKDKDAGHYRGTGIFPAENHVLLLEDEPSHCRRNGLIWKLMEVEIKGNEGSILARREPQKKDEKKYEPEKMTFDAATRIWRGRESIRISDLINEKVWPANGKKELNDQARSCLASPGNPPLEMG